MASVKDMNDWGLDIENCRRIRENDYLELIRNDCKPLKGDVLIAKDGSYLKHIFVVDKESDLAILSSIAILRPNERMNPYFLAMYLKDSSVAARMKGYVSGVAIPRIVLKDFRKFEIVIPPEPLQKAWWGIAEPLINQCLRLMDKNANLRRTRDLLLPKLISGMLNVENLEIKVENLNS
jgi:type I restriction enzyme S subunit